MKNLTQLIILLLVCATNLAAQSNSPNLETVFQWKDTSIAGSTVFDNAYNEVWGFVQNEYEFAVIGSTEGTHIFDVTDAANAYQVAFVEGAVAGPEIIHRDFHDYAGYLYVVADEGEESTLQIIDCNNLPFGVETVYDSNELLIRSHNIFIDTATARLYSCGGSTLEGGGQFLVASLENPEQPVLLKNYLGNTPWEYVHDAYIKNDTAFLNAEDAMYIVDFADIDNPQVLGSITDYVGLGYNHSGWLSDDGKTYAMCDETHGSPVYLFDVSDYTDINLITTVQSPSPLESSIAHNVMIKGNYMFVSYYYDGLQIYEITNPILTCEAGNFDTSDWVFDNNYRGNWGMYCHLPSGLILASDMQEGLFVFQVVEAETPDLPCAISPASWIEEQENVAVEDILSAEEMTVFPTNFTNTVHISLPENTRFNVKLIAADGRIVAEQTNIEATNYSFNISEKTAEGIYFLQIETEKGTAFTQRLLKTAIR